MKMQRFFAMALAMAVLLCACGHKPIEDTPPTLSAVTTETELKTAMDAGGRVALDGDIALSANVVIQGHLFDGCGHTLTGPKYVENNVPTENAITMVGGMVENVTVKGGYRGIGDTSENRASGDIRINNVTVDSDVYALNFGYGTGTGGMFATGSTFNGWTSYAKLTQAKFTDCTFGWSESGKQGTLRPYINTTLTGCTFVSKTEDGVEVPFNISFKSGSAGIVLVLENCYVGDILITQENLTELLTINLEGNTIDIRNTVG